MNMVRSVEHDEVDEMNWKLHEDSDIHGLVQSRQTINPSLLQELIDEADDWGGVLLNAIGWIPEHIPVCASKTVL